MKVIFISILLIGGWSSSAFANSMQVIGANSIALECFRLSSASSLTGQSSYSDIKVCDNAIVNGQLKKKDLIATHVNRGIIYVALENFKMAARDYNRAIKLSDNVPEAYVNRGNLWFIAKRYQAAIADYDRSLEHEFAQAHVALLNRGMAYEALSKFVPAKADYIAALQLRDDWTEAKLKLSRVNKKLLKFKTL